MQPLVVRAQIEGVALQLRAGQYRTTGLVTNTSFNQPTIRGAGMMPTTLEVTGGGAGVGLEIRSVGGVNAYRVRFIGLATGWLLHNFGANNFTEFCILHNCYMTASVVQPVELRWTSGKESFHGCGFRDTIIVQADDAANPVIKVGAG